MIGGKAANLAMLATGGLPVPDGFIVPTGSEPAVEDIGHAVKRLGGDRCAVRSSAAGPGAPFR